MRPAEQVLRNSRLPDKECDFFTALTDYFPCFFDIKVESARRVLVRLWYSRCEASQSSAFRTAHYTARSLCTAPPTGRPAAVSGVPYLPLVYRGCWSLPYRLCRCSGGGSCPMVWLLEDVRGSGGPGGQWGQ